MISLPDSQFTRFSTQLTTQKQNNVHAKKGPALSRSLYSVAILLQGLLADLNHPDVISYGNLICIKLKYKKIK